MCEDFATRADWLEDLQRYKDIGTRAVSDRTRRPHRHANQLLMAVEKSIVRLKKD